MKGHAIVVIGASAGGLGGLLTIAAGLPPTLSAAVFVVLHTATSNSVSLAELLQSKCRLPVAYPRNNDPIGGGKPETPKILSENVTGDIFGCISYPILFAAHVLPGLCRYFRQVVPCVAKHMFGVDPRQGRP